jgi:hypothetical protein
MVGGRTAIARAFHANYGRWLARHDDLGDADPPLRFAAHLADAEPDLLDDLADTVAHHPDPNVQALARQAFLTAGEGR